MRARESRVIPPLTVQVAGGVTWFATQLCSTYEVGHKGLTLDRNKGADGWEKNKGASLRESASQCDGTNVAGVTEFLEDTSHICEHSRFVHMPPSPLKNIQCLTC